MNMDFINLTEDNLADEHLCCIIRSKKPHPGVEAKRKWLADRLREGHVFRKLNEKAVVFKMCIRDRYCQGFSVAQADGPVYPAESKIQA